VGVIGHTREEFRDDFTVKKRKGERESLSMDERKAKKQFYEEKIYYVLIALNILAHRF
jgi:hypothetical protein